MIKPPQKSFAGSPRTLAGTILSLTVVHQAHYVLPAAASHALLSARHNQDFVTRPCKVMTRSTVMLVCWATSYIVLTNLAQCMIWSFLSLGFSQWIYQTIKRGELRNKYGIQGSCCGDCCVSMCCGCCALIQEEKEAEIRTRPQVTGYQMAPQMAYPQ
ncbi:PLAC8 family protein [Aspergillus niger CBS 101883]|uniref:PLAC8 family protein n=1 Tax=Aspergillus lacticoffeatus (strain CBS 101883) TaxID=1450533 RepID=UPI000D80120F|nr:uncharacterized protein BO96DRAFT_75018 [Aspergillus niger CBS 101883]PYH55385.1 hypothetical protein BO96DRAFT_75018 [Aspergillus niger CBS 101883]